MKSEKFRGGKFLCSWSFKILGIKTLECAKDRAFTFFELLYGHWNKDIKTEPLFASTTYKGKSGKYATTQKHFYSNF